MADKVSEYQVIPSDIIAFALDKSSHPNGDISTLHYLAHTEGGISLRALARQSGVHASTVLRQIRRVEAKRDDPLVDAYLQDLGQLWAKKSTTGKSSVTTKSAPTKTDPKAIRRAEAETLRVLRRLCEKGNFMAVTPGLERAVIMNQSDCGAQKRSACSTARWLRTSWRATGWSAPAPAG